MAIACAKVQFALHHITLMHIQILSFKLVQTLYQIEIIAVSELCCPLDLAPISYVYRLFI